MIQIDVATKTKSGLDLPVGILLDVNPHFQTRVDENGDTHHDISFDVDVYENMVNYQAGNILTKDYMEKFNIGFTAPDVDIQALTSVTGLIALLETHIKDGDGGAYVGIGANTTIVYAPVPV